MGQLDAGTLDILNVGLGHLTLTVTPGDAVEIAKAKRVVTDMLHRGYAIFVETPEGLQPVRRFDPEKLVYIIDDTLHTTPAPTATPPKKRDGRRGYKRGRAIPVTGAKATAVGRTAGG